MDRRQFMAGVASAAAGGVFGGTALAADLLKFIYPYAPGSGGDILVRVTIQGPRRGPCVLAEAVLVRRGDAA